MITNVDVVVTDRSGKPVRGLTADDFEIREDGKLQTITNFTAFDATSTAARAEEPGDLETAQAASAKLPRLIVLFVDIGDIEPSRRQRFFSSVESFLDKALRDGDLVTVLTWNHRVHTLLAPTADRKRVEIVLNGFSEPYGKREVKIFRALAEQSAVQSERDAEISSDLGTAIETDAVAESEFQEWLLAEERCQMIKRKARELRNVLTSLSRVEMRKVVIVASDDLSLQPADDCLTGPDLEKLAVTANAYGMTIHAFHPPGPRDSFIGPDQGGFLPRTTAPSPMSTAYARAHDETGGLTLLAERTGGLTGSGLQSGTVLQQVAQGLDSYYSLGYRISPGSEDEPRKIEVTTKNRKYRVRARQSVVRLSEASTIRDLVISTLYLPETKGQQTPMFDVDVTKSRRDGRFLIVDVEVSIRAGDLVFLPAGTEGVKGSFSVFLSGGRVLGDASDVVEMKQPIESPSRVEKDSRVKYEFSVRVRPDTRRLSIAVRDNVSGDVAVKLIELERSEG